MTSRSDLPFGSKSAPPLPPPIGNVESEFLRIYSKPKNLRIERLTDGWNLRPPLYGPIAELYYTLKPRLISTSPLSLIHGTLKMITLSGSNILSKIGIYFGSASRIGVSDSKISVTA